MSYNLSLHVSIFIKEIICMNTYWEVILVQVSARADFGNIVHLSGISKPLNSGFS